jgi:hypothetical protein
VTLDDLPARPVTIEELTADGSRGAADAQPDQTITGAVR